MFDDTPGAGHNSGALAAGEVRQLVERYGRLEDEKRGISDDMKDVRAEAKARGYNPKMIVRLEKEVRADKEKRALERAEWETYLAAMGLL